MLDDFLPNLTCHTSFSRYDVGGGAFDNRLFSVVEQTAALNSTVGTLVELARKIFNREAEIAVVVRERLLIDVVDRRFGKDSDKSLAIGLVREVLNIVADEDANSVSADVEIVEHFVFEFNSLDCEFGLLFYVNSTYCVHLLCSGLKGFLEEIDRLDYLERLD
jgi:hypothetical protein